MTTLQLGEIEVDVLKKDIKNLHLSVHPPSGRVTISAPSRLSMDTIRVYAISKLDWIKKHQKQLREQDRETPRDFIDRESHYLWGKRYLLRVTEANQPPAISIDHRKLFLQVRPGTDTKARAAIVDQWYREQIKNAAPPLIAKWEPVLGVKVENFFVRRMRTKWGSCTPSKRTIRLNTDLARKPPECLEYIIVHEMVHLLEPTHNARFIALMGEYMPQWKSHRDLLNSLPVRHEAWGY
ncbi:MAG: SprT family zinc-dependent metalloprotease [Verrucomicrobiales bacterium]